MDDKTRDKARISMREILESAGYDVMEVDPPLDLSAVRDTDCLLVLCSNENSEIQEFDRTSYKLKSDDGEMVCKKLLFTIDEGVNLENSIVWGVKEFVQYAGEAALARIMDRELSLSFASSEDIHLREEKDQEPTDSGSGVSIAHLPVKVNKQAAEQIAAIQGTVHLRFIPHWFYHFQSSGEQVYKDKHIPFDAEGSGGINAINGLRVDACETRSVDGPVPADADIVQPHISREEATERIYEELITQLTQRVRIKQEKGDAIFYEEKVMKPERKDISLEIYQVYVPVWQIRGRKIVEVNAHSGEILSTPMDEGVEIL